MITEIVGATFTVLGVFFSLVGVIGIMRLPDVYSRIHASGKVATLGIFGLLIGLALLLFLLISSPVASHAIAAAAYRSNVPLADVQRDDLAGVSRPQSKRSHNAG